MRVVHRVRKPQVRGTTGLDAREPRLGDADDLKLPAVSQRHPLANDAGVVAESTHPERMAHDRYRMRSRPHVVLSCEQSSDGGDDAQHVERVARHELQAQSFPLSRPGRGRERYGLDDLIADGDQVEAPTRGVPETHEERIAERVVLGPLGRAGGHGQVDELFGVTHGQRPQDQGVDKRERRHARAERERQRQDGRARDTGLLAQHAQAQTNVAQERIQPGVQLDVPALLAQPQRIAEPARRLFGRGLPRHPRGRQLADALGDVKLKLLVQIALDARGTKHIRQAGPQRHRTPSAALLFVYTGLLPRHLIIASEGSSNTQPRGTPPCRRALGRGSRRAQRSSRVLSADSRSRQQTLISSATLALGRRSCDNAAWLLSSPLGR